MACSRYSRSETQAGNRIISDIEARRSFALSNNLMTMRDHRPLSLIVDNARKSIRAWQDRVRDSSLTILLVLELCAIFFTAPLAAKGLPLARMLADALVLAVLVIVVVLSHRPGAIVLILLGLATIGASLVLRGEWSSVSTIALRRGGDIFAFWVVAHAVYAPGRITFRRLQGAVVLYLSDATLRVRCRQGATGPATAGSVCRRPLR